MCLGFRDYYILRVPHHLVSVICYKINYYLSVFLFLFSLHLVFLFHVFLCVSTCSDFVYDSNKKKKEHKKILKKLEKK